MPGAAGIGAHPLGLDGRDPARRDIPSPSMGEGQGEGERGQKGGAILPILEILQIRVQTLDNRYICSNIATKRRSDVHRSGALKTKNRRVETGARNLFRRSLNTTE